MTRSLILAYGVGSYILFFALFLYLIGFVGGFVPRNVDTGTQGSSIVDLAIDLALLWVFAVQHSVMARPAFKRWWTRIIPQAAERSTYVLATSLALLLIFWQWRPMPEIVWGIANPVGRTIVWAVFWLGWGIVLVSTFLIDHFDLFGLRQVYLFATGQPYTPIGFRTPWLYRIVRHTHDGFRDRLLGGADDDRRPFAL